MQRELKFRAYHLVDKKYVPIIGFDLEHADYVIRIEGTPAIVPMKVLNVQQSTGLKDKQGKEIYEGDYLRQKTHPCSPNKDSVIDYDPLFDHYEIQWDSRKNGWNAFPISALSSKDFDIAIQQLGGLITWPCEDVLANPFHYEIIGNIYENPELSQDGS